MRYNEDFIDPLKQDLRQRKFLITNPNDFVFLPYSIQVKDAPRGALLELTTTAETTSCIIGDTGDLKYNYREYNIQEDDNTYTAIQDNTYAVIQTAKFLGQLAVWSNNIGVSDIKITQTTKDSTSAGVFYDITDNLWKWRDNDLKIYLVDFYKGLMPTESNKVTISSNKTLTESDFKYLRIRKPIIISGDINILAKVVVPITI